MKIPRALASSVELPPHEAACHWSGGKAVARFGSTMVEVETDAGLCILCDPAVATPGLQLITAADLINFWRPDHHGAISKGVLSRPAFIIERP
jgi:hypothetical protein